MLLRAFISEIENNNHQYIRKFIDVHPNLILQTDEAGNYLSHAVAASGDAESIHIIYQAYLRRGHADLFLIGNDEGNTPLHEAARWNKADAVDCFIQTIGIASSSESAKTINKGDYLPSHLLWDNPHGKDRERILKLLDPLVFLQTVKPLSELINPTEIIEHYRKENVDEKLIANLYIACRVLNHTRIRIKDSATHPQFNSYSKIKKGKIRQQIFQMRQECNIKEILTCKGSSGNLIPQKILDNHFDFIKNFQVGNCNEYAFFSLKILTILNPAIRGELHDLNNGDHVVLVIGRDEKTDLNDYRTWNKDTVICDPWSGNVFPATEIPKKMKDFIKYNDQNIQTPFNSQVHSLNRLFSIEPKKEFKETPAENTQRCAAELLPPLKVTRKHR